MKICIAILTHHGPTSVPAKPLPMSSFYFIKLKVKELGRNFRGSAGD